MSISRRSLLTALSAAPLATLLPRAAFAAYPDKPIRLIVPFAAGGNADFVARIAAEGMGSSLGQPIVVETRTGAGGSIGAAAVATATPDGYTLLAGSNGPLTVNPFVQAKLPYDSLKDFIPIGLIASSPHSIVLHNSVPAKTVQELVELSKKQQVTLATSGVGSATHLTLERFKQATGANITHVPYRGGGALAGDVLAGAVSGAMTEVSTLLEHHGHGKVRILAVASARRIAKISDVPTFMESGVKDFTAASFVGVLAPAKTPAEIVAQLEKAMAKALAEKAAQDRLIASGAEPATADLQSSKGFGAYIQEEYDNAREAAKVAGLKPE